MAAASTSILDKAVEAVTASALISWINSATYHTSSTVTINAAIRSFIKYHNLEDADYTTDGLRQLYLRKRKNFIVDVRKNINNLDLDNPYDSELLTRMKSIERKIDQFKMASPARKQFPGN